MTFTVKQKINVCNGKLLRMSHESESTGTTMDVNVYLPKQYWQCVRGNEALMKPIPTIYYLSGLTCTPQNASEKAMWQFQADKYGFVVVFPDTSPRGDDVPGDPEGSWDFGHGAGFYIDATKEPYSKNYNMYTYVHEELPRVLDQHFADTGKHVDFLENVSITGHSMGGYGALCGFLKQQAHYKSCSAFAPIVNPKNVPWGQKAFNGYLESKAEWDLHDPCELIKQTPREERRHILIHVGDADPFYEEQLKPQSIVEASQDTPWANKIELNIVAGFDHSYYFVSTFVPQHAKFHAEHLGLKEH
ncbi:S-formylglutathione hydrolase KNAG_0B05290 [Huiozyma naganishii CBS 8797]|uniref:S-formylglutathione hydrolase n=1 Tax=Huiozyma naganishii (strain ATCC MYA-139 / BCRC 22969 / CBS 8797 / KCTC 17520 / NBRC 10181 / NCYC 3082 / Yp74L-3) TaxID=1071383 RepID=J7RVL9_HUIN7|nr:hypothetical protein KNAG_0B05290 [Kazachstania naganishii CBS 8797]CCK68962.1 hypothetical protein KNAG_0B05290 [Kazachstania naganishii CBS 8797]